jgi:acid stress-induced BolA-like protein IbaG/YrbA
MNDKSINKSITAYKKIIDKFYEKFIDKSSFLSSPMAKDPNEINLKHIVNGKVHRVDLNLNELGILLINIMPKYIDVLERTKRDPFLSHAGKILELGGRMDYPIIQIDNPKYARYGRKLVALDEILSDATKHVQIESTNSPFSNTYFIPQLDLLNIKQLLVIGIRFELIEQIAIEANNKQYQVIIVPELVANKNLVNDDIDYKKLMRSPDILNTNTLFVKDLEYISAIMAKKKEPKWKKPFVTTNKGKLYK